VHFAFLNGKIQVLNYDLRFWGVNRGNSKNAGTGVVQRLVGFGSFSTGKQSKGIFLEHPDQLQLAVRQNRS
jgi:hypothetical protein